MILAGPTGAGKYTLALMLARTLDTTVEELFYVIDGED